MNIKPLSALSLLLPLIAGALTVLAFAPFGYWPVQILSLAFVFHLALRAASIRKSALIGWAYGFGWSVCGIHWMFVSMHRYGGMAAWIAALAVILLSLVLGAFAALALGAGAWLRQRLSSPAAVGALLILPSFWALSEWLRGWVFTGLPWVVSGYAHTSSPLASFAPAVGVFGIGWLAALAAGCIAVLPFRQTGGRILALLLAIVIFATGYAFSDIPWTQPHGQPINVRLLQTNVPQEMKFARPQIEAMLALNHGMITETPADLIATPETAIPILAQRLPTNYLPRLAEFAKKTNSHLLLGIPVYDGAIEYTNSAIGIAPDTTAYRYDKHHLVPFGEFVPTGFRWFVNLMRIPLGDFSRGAAVQLPFGVKDQWVLPNICYEDLFGEEIADQIAASHYAGKPQPSILLNMSNIAWFGDTIALPQHLQISQMRSLETGRPMLRATNTGMTAVINPKGEIAAQLPPYSRATLAAQVQGYQGVTPYILYGNAIVVSAALLMLLLAWLLARRARRKSIWR